MRLLSSSQVANAGDCVEIGPLRRNHQAGVSGRTEQGLVEHFIARMDERFDEDVLLRLARSDVMPADLVILGPSQDRFAGEFRDL
jgi:hypothetical protein